MNPSHRDPPESSAELLKAAPVPDTLWGSDWLGLEWAPPEAGSTSFSGDSDVQLTLGTTEC